MCVYLKAIKENSISIILNLEKMVSPYTLPSLKSLFITKQCGALNIPKDHSLLPHLPLELPNHDIIYGNILFSINFNQRDAYSSSVLSSVFFLRLRRCIFITLYMSVFGGIDQVLNAHAQHFPILFHNGFRCSHLSTDHLLHPIIAQSKRVCIIIIYYEIKNICQKLLYF